MADPNDIAIVGMALRVPGATTPEEYWQNLRQGVEAIQSYPEELLRSRGVPASLLANPEYVRSGMPLSNFDQFDPEFFGFSPKEAAILDPQHRQFYEVAWEALERAGCDPGRFNGAIGVYAGCGMGAYFAQNILRNADLMRSVGLFLLRHTGNDKDFLSTRVSYAFDLKGPSINVQTACSTSLVATHLAVQSLLAREVDLALAGGVTIEIPHGVGYLYQEGEILSPDGHCRAFDHRSKGTVFGSGAGAVVLRRLEDALRDGDHVHAVIKGSAINNDGASKVGYLAPSVEGQAAAISEAIVLAGIESSSIGFVECHGTGTPMGDPIEVAALTQAFRESSEKVGHCLLGSVKSNIGHLDTAAGVAGLIKAVLSLEHQEIPPSLNFEANNPAIAFEGSPFAVAAKLTPWPRHAEPRRAAVNSLGVGGTNAFIVLEEAPASATPPASSGAELIAISARTRKALDDYAARLAAWIRENPGTSLAQLAASLGLGRKVFEHRRVLAAQSVEELADLLERGDARRIFTHTQEIDRPSVVFMFPGGGAQYAGMGRSLYASQPAFRRAMDQGLELLLSRFGVDLRGVFLTDAVDAKATDDALNKPSIQLPLVFLIEQALVALWQSHGVKPAALIGHSMGENAAACAAGVFSMEDGLGLVLLRGQLMDEVPDGGMLSVPLEAGELRSLLGPNLDLAAANGPMLSIASGPSAALIELAERLAARGVDSRRVRINIAAHSRMLEGILERFRKYLQGISLKAPSIPIVSNLTGQWLTPGEATDPEYWVRHLRNTVQFNAGVRVLLESKDRVFLEVGPGSILGSFVRQSHEAPVQRVVGSLRHPDDPAADDVYFRTVAGRLWANGVPVQQDLLWSKETPRIPLPTYAFQHSRFWIEPSAPDTVSSDDEALVPERLENIQDWLSGPRWVQHGILESADLQPQSWCVFHDRDPLLLNCVKSLRDHGHRVIEVIAGDTFSREGEDAYTLAPESGGAAYQELIDSLSARDRLPDRVLHAWLVTRTESFRPGKTFLHRNQECGFYSLFYLARAISKRAEGKRSHWIVLGNGAVSVAGERLAYPDKATVLGACGVVPREMPWITCAYVDIALSSPESEARTAFGVLEELRAPPANAVLAWRDRVRWKRYIAPHRSKASGRSVDLRPGGVYVITGGFGGIAGVLADWLAREYQARLVLMSRTPLPARDEWNRWVAERDAGDSISAAISRVRDLEAAGAEVLPLAVDVTVAEQVEDALAAIRMKFGVVNGVFHAAGVLRDGLIPLKGERDIEEVFAAKLYGTLVLDNVFRDVKLDFMVLFSSISTFVSPAGQIDYAAANAFLNAFAESCRRQRPFPVVAIDWGIWKGVGMVAKSPSAQAEGEQARLELARSREVPTNYPLFQSHHVSGDGTSQVHWITGRISGQADWLANEHRLLRGDALVPATGYVELIRAALSEINNGGGAWSMTSLTFLRPFYVDDTEDRLFRMRLFGSGSRWRVELLDATWQRVATARIVPVADSDPGKVDVASIRNRCNEWTEVASGEASIRTRQEAHLRFGPRWRVLRSIQFCRHEAFATLRLASGLVGDLETYRVHPGLLDIASGCAMDLIPGYREQETPENLWVPLGYARFTAYASLPAECHSWIRVAPDGSAATGFASFDVKLMDAHGVLIAEIEGLQVRRIEGELPRSSANAGTGVASDGHPRSAGAAEKALAHNMARGISDIEGVATLQRILTNVDRPVVIASSFRPTDLMRQADAVARMAQTADSTRFARPELETNFEAPRDEIERSLAELWGKLLGVEGVGIRDSFFDLGGHSLVAVRLFNEIADQYEVEMPMSVLMQYPNIAALAKRIRGGAVGDATAEVRILPAAMTEAYEYLVPMHSGSVGAGTPLFVVSGMFGNVLNLSHLAHLLGEDRPFFALQARGLYGDQQPHESFEEMAQAYLEEVRRVQPNGPYLLGGFSGGGLVAFEMARRLREAGEQVSAMILLDTPIREGNQFSLFNRVEMVIPELRREGIGFLVRRIRTRMKRTQSGGNPGVAAAADAGRSAQFQSQRIGDAFLRALRKYRIPKVDIRVTLLRPRLKVKYSLRDGRHLDADRNVVLPDNGWTPYVDAVTIVEVPGSHDSMVLEPNVRVLVATIRRILAAAEAD
jgi:acyl transferase domain-containing protein/thioesterase domain-containing protein/acyl carrier protein